MRVQFGLFLLCISFVHFTRRHRLRWRLCMKVTSLNAANRTTDASISHVCSVCLCVCVCLSVCNIIKISPKHIRVPPKNNHPA